MHSTRNGDEKCIAESKQVMSASATCAFSRSVGKVWPVKLFPTLRLDFENAEYRIILMEQKRSFVKTLPAEMLYRMLHSEICVIN